MFNWTYNKIGTAVTIAIIAAGKDRVTPELCVVKVAVGAATGTAAGDAIGDTTGDATGVTGETIGDSAGDTGDAVGGEMGTGICTAQVPSLKHTSLDVFVSPSSHV